MSFLTALTEQIALLDSGDPLEAFDRYFADNGVMFDNDHLFGNGKAECRAKQEPFISRATIIVGNITRCTLNEDEAICAFRNQSTFVDENGKQMQIDGVHWQRWVHGKIVEERYYRGDLMEQKIEEGILDLGKVL